MIDCKAGSVPAGADIIASLLTSVYGQGPWDTEVEPLDTLALNASRSAILREIRQVDGTLDVSDISTLAVCCEAAASACQGRVRPEHYRILVWVVGRRLRGELGPEAWRLFLGLYNASQCGRYDWTVRPGNDADELWVFHDREDDGDMVPTWPVDPDCLRRDHAELLDLAGVSVA